MTCRRPREDHLHRSMGKRSAYLAATRLCSYLRKREILAKYADVVVLEKFMTNNAYEDG